MDKWLTSAMCIKEVVTDGHLEIGALMSNYHVNTHNVFQCNLIDLMHNGIRRLDACEECWS